MHGRFVWLRVGVSYARCGIHGRRNRGVWGDNVPPTFGTSGVQGVQGGGGSMKMIFASTADSLYSVLYKWLNFNSLDSSRHLPS